MLVTADLAAFYRIWLGHLDFSAALQADLVKVEAVPALAHDFPNWFAYSHAAAAVRAVTTAAPVEL